MRVLVVEHEKPLASQLRRILAPMFVVDIKHSGKEGLFVALTHEYDLFILDAQLPDNSGLELCQELRRQQLTVPILVLSSRDTIESKVVMLNAGADEYLVKPYSPAELTARIKALLRRNPTCHSVVIKHGEFELHTIAHLILFRGKPLPLTRKEFLILQYLIRHPREIISRLQLAEHIWENDVHALTSNTVDVHINSLRRKIGKPESTGLIKTVHGSGYIMI